MGFRINTNLSSLRAQRSVTLRNEESGGNFSRLSTGRFSARDDASGLGISERMGSQIRSHSEVIHNTQSGIDYAAQADSQLGEVSTNLARLREIAVEASNGTLSDSDREALQDEFGELIEEIDSIASAEGTSGSIALDGSESIQIQAGIDADSTVSS
ncbi:MAG: flagellin, partial [Planctomycetota bacterium]